MARAHSGAGRLSGLVAAVLGSSWTIAFETHADPETDAEAVPSAEHHPVRPRLAHSLQLPSRGRDFAALWAIPAAILGLAYARTGRFTEAVPLIERAAEIASMLGAPILGFLSEAYLLSNRLDEASSVAHRALELSVERRERGWEAWSLRILGDITVQQVEDAFHHAASPA